MDTQSIYQLVQDFATIHSMMPLNFLMVILWFFITYITSYIFFPSRLFATVRDILSYVDV